MAEQFDLSDPRAGRARDPFTLVVQREVDNVPESLQAHLVAGDPQVRRVGQPVLRHGLRRTVVDQPAVPFELQADSGGAQPAFVEGADQERQVEAYVTGAPVEVEPLRPRTGKPGRVRDRVKPVHRSQNHGGIRIGPGLVPYGVGPSLDAGGFKVAQ